MSETQDATKLENRGGRPRKRNTLVVSVRLPDDVYDAYCRGAIRSEEEVRTIIRRVLTQYAPKN